MKCSTCNTDNSKCKNDKACWCMGYPSLSELYRLLELEVPEKSRCMCEKCLKKEIKIRVEEYVELFKNNKIKNHAPHFHDKNKKLIKDIDYYMENGNWVFTSWSHMKRGYCCKSGCRHCPYSYKR